jgi:hypothetical protein
MEEEEGDGGRGRRKGMVGVWCEGGLGEDRRWVVDDEEEEGEEGQTGQVL